jgi:membrane protein
MGLKSDLSDAVAVARDRNLTFMAAGIAHYTLASMVPLVLLVLAVGTLLGSEQAIEAFVENQLGSVLSESGRQLVVGAFTDLEGQVGAGVIGIAAAVWSGSKVFRGLTIAFSELYDRYDSPSLLSQLRDAVVVIGLLFCAIGAAAAMRFVVDLVPFADRVPLVVNAVLLFLTLVLLLTPIYYVLTPGQRRLGDVVPGTVFTAFGFILLQVGFIYYAQQADQFKALGVVGAVLLFVTWLYFGSVLLLAGGTLNYVTSTRRVSL